MISIYFSSVGDTLTSNPNARHLLSSVKFCLHRTFLIYHNLFFSVNTFFIYLHLNWQKIIGFLTYLNYFLFFLEQIFNQTFLLLRNLFCPIYLLNLLNKSSWVNFYTRSHCACNCNIL